MMNINNDAFDRWSRDYRNRMETVIRARFRQRGQDDSEADTYIAECCWEHPGVTWARLAGQRNDPLVSAEIGLD